MKYLNKIIEGGLYSLVFILPLGTRWIIKAGQLNSGPWEYGTYSLYGTDILLVLLLLLFIIYKLLNNFQTKFKLPARWFIASLILATGSSVIFAFDKFLALYKFSWLILGVGLFWLIISVNYDRLKLIYAMLAGVFFSAGLGIWQFLSQSSFASKWLGLAAHNGADLGTSVIEAVGSDGIGERWLRAYGSLDHPNIFGGMLAVAILLLIGEKLRINYDERKIPTRRLTNYIIWLWLAVLTAGLFFSFSRSAWLALAVGLIIMAVSTVARRNLKWQKKLAEIIIAMSILILVLFSQYQNLITTRFSGEGRLEIKSTAERLASYQEAWPVIKNNWLVGVGQGNYTLALNQVFPGQGSYFYQPAHNVFLLVWAETGIFGLIFFMGLMIYFIILNYQAKETISGLPILMAMLAIMFLDHWFFSLHFGVLFFWLILGLVYRKNLQIAEA